MLLDCFSFQCFCLEIQGHFDFYSWHMISFFFLRRYLDLPFSQVFWNFIMFKTILVVSHAKNIGVIFVSFFSSYPCISPSANSLSTFNYFQFHYCGPSHHLLSYFVRTKTSLDSAAAAPTGKTDFDTYPYEVNTHTVGDYITYKWGYRT